jgi:predicted dehydrogenase
MADKKKVLIIGCGNIGALYDFKKEGIKTHVKAFTENGNFNTLVYDRDEDLAQGIAQHYNISAIKQVSAVSDVDVIVISTPTNTHFDYLQQFLKMNVPVIVCEKPVTDNPADLKILQELKKDSSSKVLVNYFRRFHPTYHKLKSMIGEIEEKLTNIHITYQRGFSNNGSHALDLLCFFFGENDLQDTSISHFAFDEFEKDPTVTLSTTFGSVPVVFHGLQHVKYSFFELKFFFETKVIAIEKNGQSIRLFAAPHNRDFSFYLPLEPVPSEFDGINATENAMKYVAETVYDWLQDPSAADNFESSIKINYETLKIIKSICHN